MCKPKTETITLEIADGTEMNAFVVQPAKCRAGLLVLQEAFGVNSHIRDVCERFAREGYLAVAPELFHRTAPPGFEGDYSDFPSVMPHMQALTDDSMAADLTATYTWLSSQAASKIGAVGYCIGGRASFLSAIVSPLDCAVSYYGGGIAPGPRGPGLLGRVSEIGCPMLLFWGGLDKHIGAEAVRATEDAFAGAGKSYVSVVMGDADHAFFCDDRPAYNAAASKQAWAMTLAFLAGHLG